MQAAVRGPGRNNPLHPPPTHGRCERVARERAGGERGFPRAGGAARGQKAECTRALRPRVKLPLQVCSGNFTQAAVMKKLYKRLRFSPTPKKGCGEKRRGFSPRGAKRPRGRFPTGNTRGGARRLPRRKAPIPPFAFAADNRVPHTRTHLPVLLVPPVPPTIVRVLEKTEKALYINKIHSVFQFTSGGIR